MLLRYWSTSLRWEKKNLGQQIRTLMTRRKGLLNSWKKQDGLGTEKGNLLKIFLIPTHTEWRKKLPREGLDLVLELKNSVVIYQYVLMLLFEAVAKRLIRKFTNVIATGSEWLNTAVMPSPRKQILWAATKLLTDLRLLTQIVCKIISTYIEVQTKPRESWTRCPSMSTIFLRQDQWQIQKYGNTKIKVQIIQWIVCSTIYNFDFSVSNHLKKEKILTKLFDFSVQWE